MSADPKTIVHFSQDFARGKAQLGGFSRIYNTCRDGNVHYIFTISTQVNQPEASDLDGIRVINLPVDRAPRSRLDQMRLLAPVARQMVRWMREHDIRPDLFFGHSQLWNFFVLSRVRAKAFPRTKILWEANVIWGIGRPRGLKHRLANLANHALQARVFGQADHIVFQTSSSRDECLARFRIPPSKCDVVTNAVQLSDIEVPHERASRNGYEVACIGLFDELNGIPFLVEFLERETVDGLAFTFIGEGKHRPAVESLAQKGRCGYLGALPYAEMQARFPSYDLLVIPRTPDVYADLYIPTKLLEALAHGVVPVCSDVGGLREVVEDGVDGFVFKAGDVESFRRALRRAAATSREELARMAERGVDKIRRRYNWRVNHDLLANVYARLAETRS
jgi:glycosyltransferase involved in cell wall biosynthesis